MTTSLQTREIPHDVLERLRSWDRIFRVWWTTHYIMGVTGTVAAITVASSPAFLRSGPNILDVLSWLSAVCLAIMTFLQPAKRARSYVAAWRLLTDACGRYQSDDVIKTTSLYDAMKAGEKFIERASEP